MDNKCVYVYLDHRKPGIYVYGDLKFEYEPIYVGKGNLNRPNNHKYLYKITNNRFYSKIKSIVNETNKFPEYIIIKNNISELDANVIEINLISLIKKIENGGTLTNLCNGGEGSSGKKTKKSTIKKFIISINKNYIKTLKKRNYNFIIKSNKTHNNKYDYSLVDYKNMSTKVKIICPIHGVFEQLPSIHSVSAGCSKCSNNCKIGVDLFVNESEKKHGIKYDYSLVDYKNNRTKVKIICPIHGVFEQTPEKHLISRGCFKCYGSCKKTTEEFIIESIKKHGIKYDYSLVDYKGSFEKIKIICPKHGIFEQISKNHSMNGYGCPICGREKKRSDNF